MKGISMTNNVDKPKILMVDDRPENLFALDRILRKLEVTLIKAASGSEALAQTIHSDFALILLDVQMPEMNGYEVAECLRGEKRTEHLPIIFITAIDRDDNRELKGYDAGAVDYIFKPIDPGILLSKVRVFIELYLNHIRLQSLVHELEKEITERKRAEIEKEAMYRKLMEVSRQAGMAEVATNILHNVGNILTSVNISTTMLLEKMRSSKLSDLKRAVEMIREHGGDIGKFVAEHPQGKHLTRYLTEFSMHLSNEQAGLLEEINALTKNIEHIKEIVRMQQSYAMISGVTETITVSDLLEDAGRICVAPLDRFHIHVLREYDDVESIIIDKHKLLQILINLVSNAKHALEDSDQQDRQMKLCIKKKGDDRVLIEVADNGIGIAKENLNRIFSYGFTTRKKGHGFGLHSSSLTAKEMGGSLSVRSDGEGKGACFLLEIPVKPDKNNQGLL